MSWIFGKFPQYSLNAFLCEYSSYNFQSDVIKRGKNDIKKGQQSGLTFETPANGQIKWLWCAISMIFIKLMRNNMIFLIKWAESLSLFRFHFSIKKSAWYLNVFNIYTKTKMTADCLPWRIPQYRIQLVQVHSEAVDNEHKRDLPTAIQER
jgi:hypothetical protein